MSKRTGAAVPPSGPGLTSSASTSFSPPPPTGAAGSVPDKQKLLLVDDGSHLSLLRALHLADVITLLNGFCGIMSVLSAMHFCLDEAQSGRLWLALAFLPAGLMFDVLDGRVARWRHQSSLMGQELDSLADLISFGVAPAAVAYALGFRSLLDTVALSFFVLCGLLRLARFNVTAHARVGPATFFQGAPIPTSLGLDALMAVCFAGGAVGPIGLPGGVWAQGHLLELHPAVLIFVAHACLMTSRSIRIPKL